MDHSSVDVDDLGGARFSEKFTRFLKGLIEPVLLMLLEILQRCEVITGRNVFKNLWKFTRQSLVQATTETQPWKLWFTWVCVWKRALGCVRSQANDWNRTVHHTAMMRLYGFQQHLLIFVKAGIAHHIPWGFNGIIFPDGFWIIQFSLAVCMSVPPAMATNYQNDCKQDPSPFPWAAMEAWWLDQPTETVDHWTSQTMTGQILETSACQRVGTVLALKFKPVCQVSSAC